MTKREEAYAAIDSERAYQNDKWGVTPGETTGHNPHTVTEWLAYMQHYISEGLKAQTLTHRQDGQAPGLDFARKVAALGVVCMEQHGAPRREGF